VAVMTSWYPRNRTWWRRVGDALSRVGNTVIGGSPAESISGRAYREAQDPCSGLWKRVRWWIDAVFRVLGEPDHCRTTHELDLERAAELLSTYK